jgi:uncharacterized membrane protein
MQISKPFMLLEPTKGLTAQQTLESIKALAEANGALILSNLAIPNYAWTVAALGASGMTAFTMYRTQQERYRTYEEFYLHDNTLTIVAAKPTCKAPLVSRLEAHWARAEVNIHNSYGSEMLEPELVLYSGQQKIRIGSFLADRDLQPTAQYINDVLRKHNGPEYSVS